MYLKYKYQNTCCWGGGYIEMHKYVWQCGHIKFWLIVNEND